MDGYPGAVSRTPPPIISDSLHEILQNENTAGLEYELKYIEALN